MRKEVWVLLQLSTIAESHVICDSCPFHVNDGNEDGCIEERKSVELESIYDSCKVEAGIQTHSFALSDHLFKDLS